MTPGMSSPQEHNKISEDVRPVHYSVVIRTDLEKEEYEGRVEIDLVIEASTSSITFHAQKPTIVTYAALSSEGLKTEGLRVASDISLDEELGRTTVTFGEALSEGTKANLALAFKGVLTGSLVGYYKSAWSHEGQTGICALTQFQATDARKAMPCWDEPAIKATFDISLLSRSDTVSLSNMDVVGTSPSDGAFPTSALFRAAEKGPSGEWTLTKFRTTPNMSTYVLAWANGKFEHVESSFTSPITGKNVKLRVYATPEHISQARFALDLKVRILPMYERLFDMPYPLPKLDTLAANDFDRGAMENWGLIMGKTAAFLYDDKTGGTKMQKHVTRYLSHHIAHQWFGNLVFMKWWNELWLNEAFAILLGEVLIVQKMHPEWRPQAEFIEMDLDAALDADGLRSSHPVDMPCPDEKAINQLFDTIMYSKGSAVLRMLCSMTGEDLFLRGVSNYLRNHLYGSAEAADLWHEISKVSGKNVTELMRSWTQIVGFPLITVAETQEGLNVKQSHFLATNDVKPDEDETVWHVPLSIQTLQNGKAVVDSSALLVQKEATIKVPNVANSLYKLNAGTTGVYRVLYPLSHISKLGDEAARPGSSLSPEDRMGLVSDTFVLARSGHGSTSAALDLINKLRNEDDNLVWSRMAEAISEVIAVWWEQPEEVRDGLIAFRRSIFGPLVEKVGWEFKGSESADVTQLRTTAISNAALADDPKTIAEIKRRFNLLVEQNDSSQIPSGLQATIYSTAVRTGGQTEWERMLEIYHRPESDAQKSWATVALCRSADPELIQRMLNMILTDAVKTHDQRTFVWLSALNPHARRPTWAFLKEHFLAFVESNKGSNRLGEMIRQAFDLFTSVDDARDVEQFFRYKDTSAYAQQVAQGLEAVRSKAAWLERDRDEVREWLAKNGYM